MSLLSGQRAYDAPGGPGLQGEWSEGRPGVVGPLRSQQVPGTDYRGRSQEEGLPDLSVSQRRRCSRGDHRDAQSRGPHCHPR